jgi:hypothetical protein
MAALSLAKLADAVEAELQQAPDVRQWRTRIRRTISDVYEEVWASRPWPFRIREAAFWVYPDFTLEKDELFVAHANGLRVFGTNGLATVLSDKMFPAAEATGGIFAEHIEHLVGAEIGIEAPSTTDKANGNWLEGPFTVQKILGPGAIFAHQLWLDPRCNVTSVDTTAAGGPFEVRFPRYLLPYDCDQLLRDGVKDEQGQALQFLDAASHRWLQQGTARPPAGGGVVPNGWTYDEGIDTTTPLHRYVSPNLWATDTLAPAWVDHHTNVPVRETIVGAASAGAGTFVIGQRYRFAVSWFYEGRFGPLSNVVEVTPTTGNQRITLSGLPEVPYVLALAPETPYGWSLAIWVAVGDGPLYLLQHLNPAPSTGAGGVSTTQVLQTAPATTNMHQKRIRQPVVTPASHRYIRLYPRPSAHRKYQIRYLRRSYPLEAEEDTPEFGEQFHMALVYIAAARIAALREGPSSRSSLMIRLTTLGERKLAELTQYYFPGQHFHARKGSILALRAGGRYRIDRVDWNGDS